MAELTDIPRPTLRHAALRGAGRALPFLLVIIPFGLLFGVVATEAGLDLVEVMAFTVLVIAGAAQFTAVQLLQDQAPVIVILATSLAVNLRMAMYSAALAPHLGHAPLWQRALVSYLLVDQSYAISHPTYEADPAMPLPEKLAFYFGVAFTIAPVWYISTFVGALTTQAMPDGIGLDFAVPVSFLALVAPALRSVPHLAAAGTSVTLALLLAGLPYSMGLIVAALVAMGVGAGTEIWLEKRR